jgi:cytidylate kinase
LHEIDTTAFARWEQTIEQMKKAEGITEDLKARDAMDWIRRVNSIRTRVEETIRAELIYN